MGRFSKDEQTEIAKQALDLENAILSGQDELSRLQAEVFRSAPEAPQRKLVDEPSPVTPDYSALPSINYTMEQFLQDDIAEHPTFVNKLYSAHPFKRAIIVTIAAFVLTLICMGLSFALSLLFGAIASYAFVSAVIYWFIKKKEYKQKRVEVENNLLQSSEYINAKAAADQAAQEKQMEIDENNRVQQEKYDQEYAQEKEKYETTIMPEYNKELAAWTEKHDKDIEATAAKLRANRQAQADLYEKTKVIPLQYRDLAALTYIYQLMSTSDYDISGAVDMYDKEVARQLERERIEEQRRTTEAHNRAAEAHERAAAATEEQNYHLNMQNELINEQNTIAEKQRKDDVRREIETLYHRHQIKKHWKNR